MAKIWPVLSPCLVVVISILFWSFLVGNHLVEDERAGSFTLINTFAAKPRL